MTIVHMADAEFDAKIAVLVAKIRSSSLNRTADVKEPFDGPIEMIPVVYAMCQVMAEACIATGHDEHAWWDLLRNAMAESIDSAEKKAWC